MSSAAQPVAKADRIKGVILAAGYGTRFLPASKTVPKELFPLIDVPVIEFIVQEFLKSGIEDILVITSRRKKVLEDYLDHEMELEMILKMVGSNRRLEKILPSEANFHFVRQREMKGTADALRLCRSFCGTAPFVVAYPDDLIFSEQPCAQQLIEVYQQTGKSVITVKDFQDEDVSRYGVAAFRREVGPRLYEVESIIEKPQPGTEPSKLVTFGRYLYTKEIFEALDQLPADWENEISQTEPLNFLAKQGRVLGLDFQGTRYDVGEPFGYLVTILEYALQNPKLSQRFKDYLRKHQERFLG